MITGRTLFNGMYEVLPGWFNYQLPFSTTIRAPFQYLLLIEWNRAGLIVHNNSFDSDGWDRISASAAVHCWIVLTHGWSLLTILKKRPHTQPTLWRKWSEIPSVRWSIPIIYQHYNQNINWPHRTALTQWTENQLSTSFQIYGVAFSNGIVTFTDIDLVFIFIYKYSYSSLDYFIHQINQIRSSMATQK